MINLTDLKPSPGAKKKTKRLGRGKGSGRGKTCGRGHKGTNARSGRGARLGFEGGQMPLLRRLPKRGFVSHRHDFNIINLDILEKNFPANSVVNPDVLREKKIVKRKGKIKILGKGKMTKPLDIKIDAFSKSAKEKIEKVGGKIIKC